MVGAKEVTASLGISEALTSLANTFVDEIQSAGPIILGAIAAGMAVMIGLKLFKKFVGKLS